MEENLTNETVDIADADATVSVGDTVAPTEPDAVGEASCPESENAASSDTEEPEIKEENPLNALVNAGLSEREAMLVLRDREDRRKQSAPDALPRCAHSPRLNISYGELAQMREIFDGLSDTEINRLYNKVTNEERI